MNTKLLICIPVLVLLAACAAPPTPTPAQQVDIANPASAYCVEQGYRSEIRTADDGSQSGLRIFLDGSECDEWAYFRGECGPAAQSGSTSSPAEIPTVRPIDPADYQGWWTYTHPVYNFSIMLSEDWVVEEVSTSDPLMSGHALNLRPKELAPDVKAGYEKIRMTFRRFGEDVLLWPTGVGAGEFIQQGTLDIAGQSALRWLLVCPNGDVTSIWYHQAESQPNITRGNMEFGFIFSGAPTHCEPGYNLSGKTQRTGEMIITSLKVP